MARAAQRRTLFVAALKLLRHLIGHDVRIVHFDHPYGCPHVDGQRVDVGALADLVRRIGVSEL